MIIRANLSIIEPTLGVMIMYMTNKFFFRKRKKKNSSFTKQAVKRHHVSVSLFTDPTTLDTLAQSRSKKLVEIPG